MSDVDLLFNDTGAEWAFNATNATSGYTISYVPGIDILIVFAIIQIGLNVCFFAANFFAWRYNR